MQEEEDDGADDDDNIECTPLTRIEEFMIQPYISVTKIRTIDPDRDAAFQLMCIWTCRKDSLVGMFPRDIVELIARKYILEKTTPIRQKEVVPLLKQSIIKMMSEFVGIGLVSFVVVGLAKLVSRFWR